MNVRTCFARTRVLASAMLWIAVVGCASSGPTRLYSGTYLITSPIEPGVNGQREGRVTLELRADGLYRMYGDSPDHPPSREGRYRETDRSLELIDTTELSAGYPMHLIVDGAFTVARDGAELVLVQSRSDGESRVLLLHQAR